MTVKILGGIDLIVATIFFALIFDANLSSMLMLFPALLLLVKGLFIFTGDALSAIDIFASFVLLFSIPFAMFSIFLWISAFLLLSKGIVSFI